MATFKYTISLGDDASLNIGFNGDVISCETKGEKGPMLKNKFQTWCGARAELNWPNISESDFLSKVGDPEIFSKWEFSAYGGGSVPKKEEPKEEEAKEPASEPEEKSSKTLFSKKNKKVDG